MRYSPKLYAQALAEVAMGQMSPSKEKEVIQNFVRAVNKRGDMQKWPKILAACEEALRRKENIRKITVESARKLQDSRKRLGNLLKAGDIVEEKINPEIIAGIRITLNDDRQFDGSLSKKLNRLFRIKNSF